MIWNLLWRGDSIMKSKLRYFLFVFMLFTIVILANGNTVIWDNLGIFPTERAEVLNGLRTKYDYAILIVVNCDKLQAILRSIRRGDSQNRTYLILNTHTYLQLQLQNPTKYFIGFDEVYIIDGTQEVTVKEP